MANGERWAAVDEGPFSVVVDVVLLFWFFYKFSSPDIGLLQPMIVSKNWGKKNSVKTSKKLRKPGRLTAIRTCRTGGGEINK